MFELFVLPDLGDIFASSSASVGDVTTAVYPLLMFLAIPIGLVLLGLAIWAVMKVTRGGASRIKGAASGKRKRGRGRRR